MKSHGSVQVLRMWCGVRTNPVLMCFDNLDGLNYEDLLVCLVLELANGLRLGTTVPSQDLSGVWVTIHG
jgi:hypothetical protein